MSLGAAAMLLALVASSCGDARATTAAPGAGADVRTTAQQLFSRVRARDWRGWRAVCALGTSGSVRRIERESRMSCPRAFSATADRWLAAAPPLPLPTPAVRVRGARATVTYRWDRRGLSTQASVRLQRVGTRWRVDLYRL